MFALPSIHWIFYSEIKIGKSGTVTLKFVDEIEFLGRFSFQVFLHSQTQKPNLLRYKMQNAKLSVCPTAFTIAWPRVIIWYLQQLIYTTTHCFY